MEDPLSFEPFLRHYVSITRRYPGEPRHNGFLLEAGTNLVAILQFHDFYPEGYSILRKSDISGIERGDREEFFENLIFCERILSQADLTFAHDISSFYTLVNSLLYNYVIIQSESFETVDDDEFYIGKVISLNEASVTLTTFNSLGVWDEAASRIPYDNITNLQFNTPYINFMSKYVKVQ